MTVHAIHEAAPRRLAYRLYGPLERPSGDVERCAAAIEAQLTAAHDFGDVSLATFMPPGGTGVAELVEELLDCSRDVMVAAGQGTRQFLDAVETYRGVLFALAATVRAS
jgi:hypothetical protein